jgi:hypothetical protein
MTIKVNGHDSKRTFLHARHSSPSCNRRLAHSPIDFIGVGWLISRCHAQGPQSANSRFVHE